MQNIASTSHFLLLILSVNCHFVKNVSVQRPQSIFSKLQNEPKFFRFEELMRNNSKARFTLFNEEVTMFVPTNVAFATHSRPVHSDAVFYHMTFKMLKLNDLENIGLWITSTEPRFPPLWITKDNTDTYINNAKIVREQSDYVTGSRGITAWNQQVLHVIDDVLDPFITQPDFSYEAYDLLSDSQFWNLSYGVVNFLHKVKENKLGELYREGFHTFFVPVDGGIEAYKLKMINQYVIYGHIIPNYVLFTRPTMKDTNYESKANDDDVYIVLALVEKDGKMFVRGKTVLGNDENRRGEFYSEILQANIPVKNGVVHLIAQPLGIFNRTLKPFPYLPIIEKISTDPGLNEMYEMGERTGFNKIFDQQNVSFTYFIPGEMAWRNMARYDLEIIGEELDFLRRHVVVSDAAYSVEYLLALSRSNKNSDIDLHTLAGTLRVSFIKMNEGYYIKWYNKYIKISRPDYECSNGMVHVLAGPIANLKKKVTLNT